MAANGCLAALRTLCGLANIDVSRFARPGSRLDESSASRAWEADRAAEA